MARTKVLKSTADVAEELGTDPKTLRRFLRSETSPIEPVGKGKRYIMDATTLRSLKKAYLAWTESKGNAVTSLKSAAS